MAIRSEDTRTSILEAALESFTAHGFEGATLQEIADRVGVTKAALYYHFRSKDDLAGALITPALTDLDAVLDEHESSRGTPARRRAFLEAYLDFLLAHRALIVYISRDLAILAHPAIAEHAESRQRRLEALLGGADRDFAERVRVTMVLGGLQAAIAQHPRVPAGELREALRDAAATLLRPRRRSTADDGSP